jgi:hypothetical protein
MLELQSEHNDMLELESEHKDIRWSFRANIRTYAGASERT